jgi:phosphoglycerate dehydrogenase-like enzyme
MKESTKPAALCVGRFEDAYRTRLIAALKDYRVVFAELETAIDEADAHSAEVMIGNPPAAALTAKPVRYPALKWLQLFMSGVDAYRGLSGITVTNARGAYGLAVSEHMTAMTLALLKRLHQYRDEQNLHNWQPRGEVRSVSGSTVLVAGLGDIGGCYARTMKALGAYIIGIKRTIENKLDYIDELLPPDRLDDALPRADIVALILPGSAATAGLFNRERIDRMKKGALLINAGRGTAVDSNALADALESGALWGAGLDVTDPEPLPACHRLMACKNALITPHVAGHFNLRQTYENIMELCIANAERYQNGEPLQNIVLE